MKTKWFNANLHITYEALRDAFVSCPFSEESGWGIQIQKYSPTSLQAKYSERVIVNDTITDPYGNTTPVHYTKYVNFNFWLIHEGKFNHILIIENPPRSIKTFVRNVIKCTSADFNVSTIQLNINSFVSLFRTKFETVEFRKAKLKGLTFGKYTSGDIELESSSDALIDISNFFENASYKIEKAKIIISKNGLNEFIDISSNGSITFDEIIFDEVMTAVENLQ